MALFAIACGLAVANVYYAHPLLDTIAADFGIAAGSAGILVTVTPGRVRTPPAAPRPARRPARPPPADRGALRPVGNRAGTCQRGLSPGVLLFGVAAVGVNAVVAQTLVAYAATLAPPHERGRIVGAVTSGILIGIVLARAFAGVVAELESWRAVLFTSAVLTLALTAALLPGLSPGGRRGAVLPRCCTPRSRSFGARRRCGFAARSRG